MGELDFIKYDELKLIKAILLITEKSKDLHEFKLALIALYRKWEEFYNKVQSDF